MHSQHIEINVSIDAKIFYQFSMFEYFSRRRGLVLPVVFACLMSAFACLCFFMDGTLLGGVLLFLGLGLPAFHIGKYIFSVKAQIKFFGLKTPKPVYALCFSPDIIEVTNHGEGCVPLRYEWSSLHNIYRFDGCIYLYVLPNKAYLLPDGQATEGADALWQMLAGNLPPEKQHDRRKKKLNNA